jgi:DNA-binding transcriptional LysR family regulator
MSIRISDVRNFVETSSCATIIQAAKKLEISQPALSESIKRLESDLKSILFYRSRSGIQLTPSGKLFLGKAHKVIQSLSELHLASTADSIFNGRTISIGCHSTVASYSIPKALSYLKEKAPDYKIELKHDLSRNIQAEIQRGNIDIGIVINPVEVPDLVILKLSFDTVRVWASKVAKATDTIICNPDLFQTQSILKKWKDKPEKIIATESLELICQLVNENIGYGILPERAVALSGFDLKKVNSLPTYMDEICLAHRPEFGKSPAEKLMVEALKNSIKAH